MGGILPDAKTKSVQECRPVTIRRNVSMNHSDQAVFALDFGGKRQACHGSGNTASERLLSIQPPFTSIVTDPQIHDVKSQLIRCRDCIKKHLVVVSAHCVEPGAVPDPSICKRRMGTTINQVANGEQPVQASAKLQRLQGRLQRPEHSVNVPDDKIPPVLVARMYGNRTIPP